MTLVSKTALQTFINSSIKDNGSTDDTKTKGIELREGMINTTDSYWHKQEATVLEEAGNTTFNKNVTFEVDKIIGKTSVGDVHAGNITLKNTSDMLIGKTAQVIHKAATEPTITAESGQIVRPIAREDYAINEYNILTFQYLGKVSTQNIWLYIVTPIELV